MYLDYVTYSIGWRGWGANYFCAKMFNNWVIIKSSLMR